MKDIIQFFEIVYTAIKRDGEYTLLRGFDKFKIVFKSEMESLIVLYASLRKNNFKYKIVGKKQYLIGTDYFDLALKDENNNIRAFIGFKILNGYDCKDITVDINKLKSKTNATDEYFDVNKLNSETIINRYILIIVYGGELEKNKKYLEEQNVDILEQVDEPKSFIETYYDVKEDDVIKDNINFYMYKVNYQPKKK